MSNALLHATQRVMERVDVERTIAFCEDCRWPFLISRKDLRIRHPHRLQRGASPKSMSPRAGAVLCPVDREAAWLDRLAFRLFEPPGVEGVDYLRFDEMRGMDAKRLKLFRDWLSMLKGGS